MLVQVSLLSVLIVFSTTENSDGRELFCQSLVRFSISDGGSKSSRGFPIPSSLPKGKVLAFMEIFSGHANRIVLIWLMCIFFIFNCYFLNASSGTPPSYANMMSIIT